MSPLVLKNLEKSTAINFRDVHSGTVLIRTINQLAGWPVSTNRLLQSWYGGA